MRFQIFLAGIILSLACVGTPVVAQTATSEKVSNRTLLRQDSDACAKQVDPHRIDLFADCTAKRQAERKAAQKQKTDACKNEAAEQNLHYLKRLRFIRKCAAAS